MIKNEFLLKICAIGPPDTAKTRVIRQFAEGKFTTNYMPTLGVDITTKKIEINNNRIKLILVDTDGREFFCKLRPSYYRGASACTLFFSLNDRTTFDTIPNWLTEFRKHIPDLKVPISLVAIHQGDKTLSSRQKNSDSANKKPQKTKRIKFQMFDSFLTWFFNNQNKKSDKRKIKHKKRCFSQNNNSLLKVSSVTSEEAKELAEYLGLNYCEINLNEPSCFEQCIRHLVRISLNSKTYN